MVGVMMLWGLLKIITMSCIWKTKEEELMQIHTMTENHIHNVIKCLKGEGKSVIPNPYMGLTTHVWLNLFQQEIINRGQPLMFN